MPFCQSTDVLSRVVMEAMEPVLDLMKDPENGDFMTTLAKCVVGSPWMGENCISAHVRTRRMGRGSAATCRFTPNTFSIARHCRKSIARNGNAATCMRGIAAILRTFLRHCHTY